MGFYATIALEATPTRQAPERLTRAVNAPRPGRVRREPVRPQNPLRGPIRKAISGYRFYNLELGRWINRDPLGDRSSVSSLAARAQVGFELWLVYTAALAEARQGASISALNRLSYWIARMIQFQRGDAGFAVQWPGHTWLYGTLVLEGGRNPYEFLCWGSAPTYEYLGLMPVSPKCRDVGRTDMGNCHYDAARRANERMHPDWRFELNLNNERLLLPVNASHNQPHPLQECFKEAAGPLREGDIVVFDGGGHSATATGKGDEIVGVNTWLADPCPLCDSPICNANNPDWYDRPRRIEDYLSDPRIFPVNPPKGYTRG